MTTPNPAYPIDCTGDVVVGDVILFFEGVFGGSFRKPAYLGDRVVEADVVRDSYGKDKQQHTFTLRVIASSGVDPIDHGAVIRRKGRNIYRNGTKRRAWADESLRKAAVDEKHNRGSIASKERAIRKGHM